jgi:hypothetical protein
MMPGARIRVHGKLKFVRLHPDDAALEIRVGKIEFTIHLRFYAGSSDSPSHKVTIRRSI